MQLASLLSFSISRSKGELSGDYLLLSPGYTKGIIQDFLRHYHVHLRVRTVSN